MFGFGLIMPKDVSIGLLNSSIQAMLASSHGKGPSFAPSRRPAAGADHFDMLEYPFITISQLPPKFIQRIGTFSTPFLRVCCSRTYILISSYWTDAQALHPLISLVENGVNTRGGNAFNMQAHCLRLLGGSN